MTTGTEMAWESAEKCDEVSMAIDTRWACSPISMYKDLETLTYISNQRSFYQQTDARLQPV